MTIFYDVKDPEAVLDYQFDWSSVVGPNDSIIVSTWVPDAGITIVSTAFTATTTTVWLSGGAVGDATHQIVNHIRTNGGRQDDQTLYLDIVEK